MKLVLTVQHENDRTCVSLKVCKTLTRQTKASRFGHTHLHALRALADLRDADPVDVVDEEQTVEELGAELGQQVVEVLDADGLVRELRLHRHARGAQREAEHGRSGQVEVLAEVRRENVREDFLKHSEAFE